MKVKKKARTKKFRLRSNSFAIATIFQWCSAKSVGHHFFVNACSNVTSTWLRPLRVHVYATKWKIFQISILLRFEIEIEATLRIVGFAEIIEPKRTVVGNTNNGTRLE